MSAIVAEPCISIAWHQKYRPKSFDELQGQEFNARLLSNLIASARIPNALLFSGTRGTGKTSSARLFAKALNCNNSDTPTTTPCSTCTSCRSIDRDASLDYTELDAASHNGVDDIRALNERAAFAPVQGRYRVFVLDEAHMLTRQAQNAFLKTLEEPAPGVIFILATTEPEKLLDTVVSRCLHLRFNRLTLKAICDRLAFVARAEGVEINDRVLTTIARISYGGMRDSLQFFSKLALSNEGTTADLTVNDVYLAAGEPLTEEIEAILVATLGSDIYQLLAISHALAERKVEAMRVMVRLLEVWKDLLAVSLTDGDPIPLSSDFQLDDIEGLLGMTCHDVLLRGFKRLEEAERRLSSSNNAYLWVQTTLLSLVVEARQ